MQGRHGHVAQGAVQVHEQCGTGARIVELPAQGGLQVREFPLHRLDQPAVKLPGQCLDFLQVPGVGQCAAEVEHDPVQGELVHGHGAAEQGPGTGEHDVQPIGGHDVVQDHRARLRLPDQLALQRATPLQLPLAQGERVAAGAALLELRLDLAHVGVVVGEHPAPVPLAVPALGRSEGLCQALPGPGHHGASELGVACLGELLGRGRPDAGVPAPAAAAGEVEVFLGLQQLQHLLGLDQATAVDEQFRQLLEHRALVPVVGHAAAPRHVAGMAADVLQCRHRPLAEEDGGLHVTAAGVEFAQALPVPPQGFALAQRLVQRQGHGVVLQRFVEASPATLYRAQGMVSLRQGVTVADVPGDPQGLLQGLYGGAGGVVIGAVGLPELQPRDVLEGEGFLLALAEVAPYLQGRPIVALGVAVHLEPLLELRHVVMGECQSPAAALGPHQFQRPGQGAHALAALAPKPQGDADLDQGLGLAEGVAVAAVEGQ